MWKIELGISWALKWQIQNSKGEDIKMPKTQRGNILNFQFINKSTIDKEQQHYSYNRTKK